MLRKINDGAVIADHGRRITKLGDDVCVLNQRLLALERRVATIENNLAELTRLYHRLDLACHDFKTEEH